MTEEDTFNRLTREPYETVRREVAEIVAQAFWANLSGGLDYRQSVLALKCLEKAGWTVEEFERVRNDRDVNVQHDGVFVDYL